MKSMIIWLVAALFLIVAVQPSYAVDKKKKDQPTTKVTDTVKKKDSTKEKSESPAKKAPTKKYNSFIDKNKNGIDDRRENLRTKKVAKSNVDSTKTTSANQKKNDTTKVASKTDSTKSSSKKSDKKK